MNLLPEFRKASKLDDSQSIAFGTVDCTMNQNLCAQHGIRSYPTTILFNNTTPHNYHGQHKAADLADFIQDVLKPSLISLNFESFNRLVGTKQVGQIWFVTFSASWCGPCQQLAPEWRKLAKKIDKKLANVGSVDCAVEQILCSEQRVTSYPNIRVYTAGSYGASSYEIYNGWMRDVNSLMQWAGNYLPSKSQHMDFKKFQSSVINQSPDETEPWLVTFSSPWCGHCHVFAPIFESIAFVRVVSASSSSIDPQFQILYAFHLETRRPGQMCQSELPGTAAHLPDGRHPSLPDRPLLHHPQAKRPDLKRESRSSNS